MLSTRISAAPHRAGDKRTGHKRRRARQAITCAAAILGTSLAAGCAVPAPHGPAIKLTSAQVTEPSASGVTDVYVDIQNDGGPDKIIAARISAGGTVTLRSPVRSGVVQMRTVLAIPIPARSFVGLDPNGSHLLVTGSGPMKAGRLITLTLVFAHAGAISVPALVTDPASGGASYFLN
jgi:copper(I)-binding protein